MNAENGFRIRKSSEHCVSYSIDGRTAVLRSCTRWTLVAAARRSLRWQVRLECAAAVDDRRSLIFTDKSNDSKARIAEKVSDGGPLTVSALTLNIASDSMLVS